MSREIKFRAWDLLHKRMLEWVEIFHLPAWEIFPGTPEQRAFQPLEYTGLKDKNGKEIYEGDVVHVIEIMYFNETERMKEWEAPVVWEGNGWYLYDPDETGCPLDGFGEGVTSLSEIEVIGNISENPDLLNIAP